MMQCIMKNKTVKATAYGLIAALFWITVWSAASAIIGLDLILPGPLKVAREILKLFISKKFWITSLFTIIRIFSGFSAGAVIGATLAILTHYSRIVNTILSPFMTVVRATPVASFIMVLWLIVGSDLVPVFITALMVAPIVWQNVKEGFNSINPELSEVCDAYELPFNSRLKFLIAPTLKNYIIPGFITSSSLAWKSGIAAEIIAYTKNSIGREIINAKNFFESAEMLAWTAIIILFSLVFEYLLRRVGRRFSKNDAKA